MDLSKYEDDFKRIKTSLNECLDTLIFIVEDLQDVKDKVLEEYSDTNHTWKSYDSDLDAKILALQGIADGIQEDYYDINEAAELLGSYYL